jgi:hypothetical protein
MTKTLERLFKYTGIKTAEKILTSRMLRWSSPLLFNDPFDVPRELIPDATVDDVREGFSRVVIELIEDDHRDLSTVKPEVAAIVEQALEMRRKSGALTNALIIATLKSQTKESGLRSESLDDLRRAWWKGLPTLRLLCLAESAKHQAMWHHYADKYEGVVLEFSTATNGKDTFSQATQVNYPQEKPDTYSAYGFARLMCRNIEHSTTEMFRQAIFTKAPDWAYEAEWRLVRSVKTHESDAHTAESELYTYYPFDPEELVGVYLGPQMKKDDRQAIMDLASKFPNAKTYDVRIGFFRELEFQVAVDADPLWWVKRPSAH